MSSYSHRSQSNRELFFKRLLVYTPVIFILSVVQCSFFAQLSILPAVPDLILGLIVGIAMLDSQRAAAVCGIGAGFVIDAIGTSGLSLSPLFYLICGAACGAFSKKMFPKFLSWTVCLSVFSLVKALLTIANVLYSFGRYPFLSMVWKILLPEFICTVIVCLPIFFVVKLCMLPIDSKRRLRLDKFN